jgi:hypothetical protein
METRRHHFVPRFLLGGFTDTSQPDGFLFVHDLKGHRRRWRMRPTGVAHVRDFYRVEVEGADPGLAESALAKVESDAAPIIRRIIDTDELPHGDEFETLLDFVAILAARVPKRRSVVQRFLSDLARMTLDISTATPERYAAQLQRLRQESKDRNDLPDVSFEKMREFVRNDPQFEVDRTWSVKTMFDEAEIIRRLLPWRTWALLRAQPDAPNFIVSDNPVSILPARPEAAGPFGGVGWGMPHTFVFVPLHRRAALFGSLNDLPPVGPPETRHLDAALPVTLRTVAAVNSGTLACAEKHVYTPLEDFIWMKPDNTIGHASDLPDLRSTAEL